jgi:hypothetical protein
MSTLPPEELKIIKGSTLSLLLLGFDENNQAESLAGADAATFAVK